MAGTSPAVPWGGTCAGTRSSSLVRVPQDWGTTAPPSPSLPNQNIFIAAQAVPWPCGQARARPTVKPVVSQQVSGGGPGAMPK